MIWTSEIYDFLYRQIELDTKGMSKEDLMGRRQEHIKCFDLL